MNAGVVGGEKLLPENWISEATSSKIIGSQKLDYGYIWWIADSAANPIHRGAFYARGIFGQSIYINPPESIIVVVWSARPKPTGSDTINDEDFFAAVVKSLH